MALSKVEQSGFHKIISIQAEALLLGKLAALGLVPGAEIEVLHGALHGAAVVSCRGSDFVLGRGIAQQILVEE